MDYTYIPKGVCSTKMTFSIEDGVVKNVNVTNGCDGNKKGIARLVEGMNPEDVISRLKGIECHSKGTSCPDQLANAIEQVLAERAQ